MDSRSVMGKVATKINTRYWIMMQTTAECSCHLDKWQKYRSLVRIVVQVQWNLIHTATGVQVLKVFF